MDLNMTKLCEIIKINLQLPSYSSSLTLNFKNDEYVKKWFLKMFENIS